MARRCGGSRAILGAHVRPAAEPTASVELIRMLLRHASRAGVAAGEICRSVGIEAAALEKPGARVSAERFFALWDEIATRTGDAEFGLHFGVAIAESASGHLLAAVLRNCGTLGDAIDRFSRYHDLLTDGVRLEARSDPGLAHLRFVPRPGVAAQRHHVEAVLSAFVTVMRRLTEDRLGLERVCFRHTGPASSPEHARVFGVPAWFGRRVDEVVLDRRSLALPIALASGELLRELELLADRQLARLAGAQTWAERAACAARDVLLAGRAPAVRDVAARLEVGPRTLQARLARERTSYRKVLDGARRELATSVLANPELALRDVVFLLGFAEQSGFNHAFKRWTGITPREFRRRRGAGEGGSR